MAAQQALRAVIASLLVGTLVAGSAEARTHRSRVVTHRKGAVQSGFTDKIDPGHFQLETNAIDWQGGDDQTTIIGDSVLRIGLPDAYEIQLGWTPVTNHAGKWGSGDLRIGGRKILSQHRFGVVIQPFITLPVGSKSFSAGHVQAGATLGLTYDLTPTTQLYATPSVLLQPRAIYSTTLGVNQHVKGPVDVAVEVFGQRQPGDPSQTQYAIGSIATYKFSQHFEINAGVNAGLNSNAPPVELVVGFTRAF